MLHWYQKMVAALRGHGSPRVANGITQFETGEDIGGGYMDTHLKCPSCHQLDRVVNVRAAYENGTTSTSQHGSALTITPDLGLAPTMMHSRGSTVSGLSQKLDSLEERPKISQGGCAPILAVGGASDYCSWFCLWEAHVDTNRGGIRWSAGRNRTVPSPENTNFS
jgi:hypothetical protein